MTTELSEGWYDDPAGDPQRERYFDGVSWSLTTRLRDDVRLSPVDGFTPAGIFNPGPPPMLQSWAPPTGDPVTQKPRRRWAPILATLLTLAVLAALAATLLIWKPFKKVDPAATASASASPSAGPSSTGTPSAVPSGAKLDCTQGSPGAMPLKSKLSSSGLSATLPATWEWRFDHSQWMWLQAGAPWGRVSQGDDVAVGMALGGIASSVGSTEAGARGVADCLVRYGMWSGGTADTATVHPTTIGGKPATELTVKLTLPSGASKHLNYDVTVLVTDVGKTEQFATATFFCPSDLREMCREAEQARASLVVG